ncbi:unnamed protein product [Ambrosiozyma monospora]|uniref:Unnamed protein product n=1 Tax=Ambrosiozyma monospora TaxID=43982 RepID=A0A9W6Z4V8_AMBMO|nr:unnamed protein product [Ambrosiozyma monospora]
MDTGRSEPPSALPSSIVLALVTFSGMLMWNFGDDANCDDYLFVDYVLSQIQSQAQLPKVYCLHSSSRRYPSTRNHQQQHLTTTSL